MTRKLSPNARFNLLRWWGFFVAEAIYLYGVWSLFASRPRFAARILEATLAPSNMLFLALIVTLGLILWPLSGRVVRHLEGMDQKRS